MCSTDQTGVHDVSQQQGRDIDSAKIRQQQQHPGGDSRKCNAAAGSAEEGNSHAIRSSDGNQRVSKDLGKKRGEGRTEAEEGRTEAEEGRGENRGEGEGSREAEEEDTREAEEEDTREGEGIREAEKDSREGEGSKEAQKSGTCIHYIYVYIYIYI